MNIDPDRSISITLPFGMIEKLKNIKPILGMFRDQGDVKSVIEIIDAIYAGAMEFIREEDGELTRLFDESLEEGDEEGDLDEFFEDEEDGGEAN